mgnify:CR=1 FL=1
MELKDWIDAFLGFGTLILGYLTYHEAKKEKTASKKPRKHKRKR